MAFISLKWLSLKTNLSGVQECSENVVKITFFICDKKFNITTTVARETGFNPLLL